MSTPMIQACERCWKRKQKCDRRKPCGSCTLAAKPCVERRLGTVVDPSDPTTPLSYIENLKRKVQWLEAQAQAQAQGRQSPMMHSVDSDGPSSVRAPDNEEDSRGSDSAGGPPQGDNLQAEMGYLSLSAMAEFSGDRPGAARSLSFHTLFRAASAVSGAELTHSTVPNAAMTGPLGELHKAFVKQGAGGISAVDAESTLRVFLDVARISFPFMDPRLLATAHDKVRRAEEHNTMDQLMTESPEEVVCAYMAVATGLLLSKDYRHAESLATMLALSSMQLMPRVLAQASELDTVRCLIAMAIFSMYSAVGGSLWHLSGLAISRCISAGMHTARVSDFGSTNQTKRENGRAFWTIYVLDTYLACSLDRPFSLHDEDITTAAPVAHDPNGMQAPADWLASNVQFAKLLHDIRHNPSLGVLFHFSNFRHWKETIPLELAADDENRGRVSQQHSRRACAVLIQLLQLSGSQPPDGVTLLVTSSAEDEFGRLLDMLERQIEDQEGVITPLDGLFVLRMGVELVRTGLQRRQAGEAGRAAHPASGDSGLIRQCLDLLLGFHERFPPAGNLHGILRSFAGVLADRGNGNAAWAAIKDRLARTDVVLSSRVQYLIYQAIASAM